MASVASVNENVRYEPDEKPPLPVALGAGVQAAAIIVAPVVLTVVIVARIADQPDSYITWGVFAALLVSGITTTLQAVRVGRVGSGHVLIMGTSGAFIAVCVAALTEAGPSTMASLIVISSLFQFLLASRLSLLRRIFTPVVSGTVIMLIAATVMPVVFDTLHEVPEGTSRAAAPISAGVTILVVAGMVLRAPPAWRLWSPIVGIAVGSIAGAPFSLYDVDQVLDASWVGAPVGSWPGIDVTPGNEFWALLPAFVVVTLVGAIETVGDGVAIQRVSQRRPRATDFRVVQGALNADGMGNLLSGLGGTLPNTTYSSSIALAEVTGISARRVGVIIGVIFVVVAFFPKFTALLVAIPAPVAAAYITVLIALPFRAGDENSDPGWDRPPEGCGGGGVVLAGHGVPERVDIPGLAGGRIPEHPAGERNDLRGDGGSRDDGIPGAYRPPTQTATGRARHGSPAQIDGVSQGVCFKGRVG